MNTCVRISDHPFGKISGRYLWKTLLVADDKNVRSCTATFLTNRRAFILSQAERNPRQDAYCAILLTLSTVSASPLDTFSPFRQPISEVQPVLVVKLKP
jgi:hypothetical protein